MTFTNIPKTGEILDFKEGKNTKKQRGHKNKLQKFNRKKYNLKIYHINKHLIVQTAFPTKELILLNIESMLQSYRIHQSIAMAQRNEQSKKPNFSLESITYKKSIAIKITGNLQNAIVALAFYKSGGLIKYDLPGSLCLLGRTLFAVQQMNTKQKSKVTEPDCKVTCFN